MVDPTPLVAAIETTLKAIPGITVYDGYVPAKVPTDPSGQYILPYVVIWAGTGDNPPEQPACGEHEQDTLVFDFQTTVIGASPAICRAVNKDVRAKLMNLRAGTGRIKPNPDGFQQQSPVLDTQVTPARFMLPKQWRLITN